jgi:Protein phosphatase 2C
MIAGIWDCLSSQAVVNFVRYQVSRGRELTEICEMMCEYCLAPDATDFGCDNMTIFIVAITHGRSKRDWYAWIKDRVKNNYGYETPSVLPQLYAQARLTAFRERRAEYDKKRKEKSAAQCDASSSSAQTAVSSWLAGEDKLPENENGFLGMLLSLLHSAVVLRLFIQWLKPQAAEKRV